MFITQLEFIFILFQQTQQSMTKKDIKSIIRITVPPMIIFLEMKLQIDNS